MAYDAKAEANRMANLRKMAHELARDSIVVESPDGRCRV
jgi:hypothetical protein